MPRPLDPVRARFPILVAQLARQWRRAIDAELQPLGLTEATWLALLHIARASETLRQKDLAASLGLDNSSVVRLLDMLQSAAYIERQEGTDRRVKTIVLTASGKAVVNRVEKIAVQKRLALLGDIPDDELAIASSVISRISQAISAPASEQAA